MSKRDPWVAVRQMLDLAEEAAELVRGKTRADLDRERVLTLALTRLVEVVGEAASRVPEELRRRRPELPWSQIVAARNRLIHGYDDISLDILWDILTEDLPALIPSLREMLGEADAG